jgi:hypothetical protein
VLSPLGLPRLGKILWLTGAAPGYRTLAEAVAAYYRLVIPAAYQEEWLSSNHVGTARERAASER